MRLIPSLLRRARYAVAGRPARPVSFARSVAEVFGGAAEASIHPHTPEERAELYSSIDDGSTELEVLGALNAFVQLFKPANALETGTWHGFGALAIAAGLRMNGRGRLTTIDIDPGAHKLARRHIALYDPALLEHVVFELSDTLEFLERYEGDPFDFVFIDSDMACRADEFLALERRGLFAPGAVCVVHDTSPHRERYGHDEAAPMRNIEVFDEARERYEGFEFPYSRGFRFLRIAPRGHDREL